MPPYYCIATVRGWDAVSMSLKPGGSRSAMLQSGAPRRVSGVRSETSRHIFARELHYLEVQHPAGLR